MTTVKVKFLLSGDGTDMGTVYYQIAQGRAVRRIATPYRISSAAWDGRRSLPAAYTGADAARRAETEGMRDGLRQGHARLMLITEELDGNGVPYTPR